MALLNSVSRHNPSLLPPSLSSFLLSLPSSLSFFPPFPLPPSLSLFVRVHSETVAIYNGILEGLMASEQGRWAISRGTNKVEACVHTRPTLAQKSLEQAKEDLIDENHKAQAMGMRIQKHKEAHQWWPSALSPTGYLTLMQE